MSGNLGTSRDSGTAGIRGEGAESPTKHRRPVTIWWREGLPTAALAVAAVMYPSRTMTALLGGVALLNWAIAQCAEWDAAMWHRLAEMRAGWYDELWKRALGMVTDQLKPTFAETSGEEPRT